MKRKYLIAFTVTTLMLMALGCAKEEKEEDGIQSITVESVGGTEGSMKEETGAKDTDPMKAAYQSVLENLYKNYSLPDGTNLGCDEFSEASENQFSIYDIDRDGKEELIVLWTTTMTAGNVEGVYDFDAASGTVRQELLEYPMLTFYENGVVEAGMSHNHGLAGEIDDFWPYTLYQYDKGSDTYLVTAVVDAWSKAYYEKDYDGKAFPDEIDGDGDGVVYLIEMSDDEKQMDLEEYEKWRESFVGGTKKIEISYQKMTEENIRKVTGIKDGYGEMK